MSECPHKEIVAFEQYTEYHKLVDYGWRCKWCHQPFIPRPPKQTGEPDKP